MAGIIHVLGNILKYLKQEYDDWLGKVYLDSISPCLSNVPRDSLDDVCVGQNGDIQRCSDAFSLRNVRLPDSRACLGQYNWKTYSTYSHCYYRLCSNRSVGWRYWWNRVQDTSKWDHSRYEVGLEEPIEIERRGICKFQWVINFSILMIQDMNR